MTENSILNIDFSYIRYANCWEDADVVLKGLQPDSTSRILSIGSAGDNSFSLLTSNPEKIVAIDLNPSQIALIELKKATIQTFEYNDVLAFLGLTDCVNREALFYLLQTVLPASVKNYWEKNINQIKAGVIHQGKFEQYFQYFSEKVLPLVHSKQAIEKLIEKKSKAEQIEYCKKKWNNWRWRLLFKIFFSKAVMGKYGRDKRFFSQVKEPVAKNIFKRVERHLSSEMLFENEFLEYILFRNFSKNLPHYLRPENFESIKKNINKLEIRQESIGVHLENKQSYTHFNLSNVFEYLNNEDFHNLAKLIEQVTARGTIFLYWNLLVPRKLSDEIPEAFLPNEKKATELSAIDKGFFYEPVVVDERR